MSRNPEKPPTVELKGPPGLVRVTVLSVRNHLAQRREIVDEEGNPTGENEAVWEAVDDNELQAGLQWLKDNQRNPQPEPEPEPAPSVVEPSDDGPDDDEEEENE